jgi:hypothetical protein
MSFDDDEPISIRETIPFSSTQPLENGDGEMNLLIEPPEPEMDSSFHDSGEE